MKNLENGTEFIWPKEKFLNRLYLMKEMYNNYEEEDDDWDLPEVTYSIFKRGHFQSSSFILHRTEWFYKIESFSFRKSYANEFFNLFGKKQHPNFIVILNG